MASSRCSSPDDDGYKRFTEDVQISYGSNDASKITLSTFDFPDKIPCLGVAVSCYRRRRGRLSEGLWLSSRAFEVIVM